MSENGRSRRRDVRLQRSFPAGKYVALLTAALVTLVGVCLQLDPLTILLRATGSAVLLGCLVSIGVGVIRVADSEYRS